MMTKALKGKMKLEELRDILEACRFPRCDLEEK